MSKFFFSPLPLYSSVTAFINIFFPNLANLICDNKGGRLIPVEGETKNPYFMSKPL